MYRFISFYYFFGYLPSIVSELNIARSISKMRRARRIRFGTAVSSAIGLCKYKQATVGVLCFVLIFFSCRHISWLVVVE